MGCDYRPLSLFIRDISHVIRLIPDCEGRRSTRYGKGYGSPRACIRKQTRAPLCALWAQLLKFLGVRVESHESQRYMKDSSRRRTVWGSARDAAEDERGAYISNTLRKAKRVRSSSHLFRASRNDYEGMYCLQNCTRQNAARATGGSRIPDGEA